jgi:hypothetical protein
MNTFVATVKVKMSSSASTALVKTQLQAENHYRAKWLLEAQYGAGNVLGTSQQVR